MNIIDVAAPPFPSWYDNGGNYLYLIIGGIVFIIAIVIFIIKRKKGKK